MKKITFAIAALFVVSLFSSCVYVGRDEDPYALIYIENDKSNEKKSNKKASKSEEVIESDDEEETSSTSKKKDTNKSSEKTTKEDSSKTEETTQKTQPSESNQTSTTTTDTSSTTEQTNQSTQTTTQQQTQSEQQTTSSQTTEQTPATTTDTTQTPEPETLYTVKALNKTSVPVIDWCVKKDNIMVFSNSDDAHAIEPNGVDTITNLSAGTYKIYFSFEGYGFGTDWTLFDAGEFELNGNQTFVITERVLEVYERAFEESRDAVK
ncbi:MAG: hypothetical protein K6G09_10105 [Treponema sp.]|nr:hypothetical protein [Treponema sp.]